MATMVASRMVTNHPMTGWVMILGILNICLLCTWIGISVVCRSHVRNSHICRQTMPKAPEHPDTTLIKALSIRQPWPWLILNGGKNIENRDWHTWYRGPVLIHTSKWFNAEEVRDDFQIAKGIASQNGVTLPSVTLRDLREWCGKLVGTVEIIDCVSASDSPWFFDRYGFVLANAKPLSAQVPCKGALGFFRPSMEVSLA
jgi:ASCH domain